MARIWGRAMTSSSRQSGPPAEASPLFLTSALTKTVPSSVAGEACNCGNVAVMGLQRGNRVARRPTYAKNAPIDVQTLFCQFSGLGTTPRNSPSFAQFRLCCATLVFGLSYSVFAIVNREGEGKLSASHCCWSVNQDADRPTILPRPGSDRIFNLDRTDHLAPHPQQRAIPDGRPFPL